MAAAMGAWLNEQGIMPDLVVCSPSVRTRETWHFASGAFDPPPPVLYVDPIYDASPETLLAVLHAVENDIATLMLVGHNPGVEALTAVLAESGEPDVVERYERKFPTAAIAVLDFEDVPWAALGEKSAWLSMFETPKNLGFKDE